MIFLYEPDASVPVHTNRFGAAAALEAATATIASASPRNPLNTTLRISYLQ